MIQPNKNLVKKPIKVSNINDPRLKLYNDSLSLYNKNNEVLKRVRKTPSRYLNKSIDNSHNNDILLIDDTLDENAEPINDNIKPVEYVTFTGRDKNPINGRPDIISRARVPKYQKPNQEVILDKNYKEPVKIITKSLPRKPLPKVEPLDKLNSKDLVIDNNFIEGSNPVNIYQKPKSYKVTEEVETPYGLGTGNTDITTYEVQDGNNISDKKINGKRTITPQFASGGTINPPNPILNTLLNNSSLYGLIQSYTNNQPYKSQDVIGALPSGVAQIASLTLEEGEKERENLKRFKTNQNRGKILKPRPLPLNIRVTDTYANGGSIGPDDPPIKSVGLTPEQQAEAEADALWNNNWNTNRVVNGTKLPKGYQIPSSQVVEAGDLSAYGESGRYDPNTKIVTLDPNNREQGVASHEYAHIYQDRTKLQRPKVYQNYINNPITTEIPNLGDYNTNPNEIHSELMRLRRNNNFQPDQVVTPDDVQDSDLSKYNFNNASKDSIIKLLNSTADINVPTTTFAAYGGNINPNTMNYAKRLPKNMRHIAPSALVGTAGSAASLIPGVGTIVGAGLGVASGIMASNEAEAEERKRQEALKAQQLSQDSIALQNYNQVGNAGVQYYANGGKLLPPSLKGKYFATGGDLTSLNSTTEVAEGNTHGENKIDGQYGITLSDGQKPIAEVEDKEVIVNNNQVYSDRLMYNGKQSYADKATQIAKKAGRIEKKLNDTTDSKSRNGYERQLAGTKMAEEALFAHQEQTKYNEGMQEIESLPTTAVMANGGILGEGTMTNVQLANRIGRFTPKIDEEEDPSFAEQLAPGLIDNVGNLLIAGNTPKIPLPTYNKVPNLETSVNINPQLSAINDNIATTSDMLLSNTNNSNVARSNIAAAKLGGLKARLGLLGERENTERGLRSENVLRQANVASSNNALTDNYNMLNFQRTGDMQGRLSANLGNLSEDIDKVYARRDAKDYYDTVQLADILDDPTGEKIRTAERNPELYQSAKTRAAIKKEAERKRLRTPYNYNNIIQSAI